MGSWRLVCADGQAVMSLPKGSQQVCGWSGFPGICSDHRYPAQGAPARNADLPNLINSSELPPHTLALTMCA